MSPKSHDRRQRGKVLAALAGTVAVIVGAGVGIRQIPSDGGASPGTANIWVDTTGGTCIRQSSPTAYSDSAACSSFDTAWDAATAGDTIRVKAGSYGIQHIDGDKGSETWIIGEDVETVLVSGSDEDCYAAFGKSTVLCANAAHLTLENVTADTNDNNGASAGSLIAAPDVTFNNVRLVGNWPDTYVDPDAHRFHWNGGVYGDADPPERPCLLSVGEVVWVEGADNVTVENVTFNKQTVEDCGVDTTHLEMVRLENDTNDFTLRNNTYSAGTDAGSGYLFMSVATNDNLHIVGNYFPDLVGSYWMQADCASGWVFAYNTFEEPAAINGSCGIVWAGNLGNAASYPGCSGTHTKNVWGGSGSCGTDTFVGASSLGVDSTGHLDAGSPAIDAGETPGASDLCTDAAYVDSVDRDGTVRPQGSVCDAGADER